MKSKIFWVGVIVCWFASAFVMYCGIHKEVKAATPSIEEIAEASYNVQGPDGTDTARLYIVQAPSGERFIITANAGGLTTVTRIR
jgi:hypothetical protein